MITEMDEMGIKNTMVRMEQRIRELEGAVKTLESEVNFLYQELEINDRKHIPKG